MIMGRVQLHMLEHTARCTRRLRATVKYDMQEVSLAPPATLGHLKVLAANGYRICRYEATFLQAHHASVTLPIHLYKRLRLETRGRCQL